MLKTYIAAQTQLHNLQDRLHNLKDRFTQDDDGAALVEYSVLVGIITVAAIVSVGLVGTWVKGAWAALVTHLGAVPT